MINFYILFKYDQLPDDYPARFILVKVTVSYSNNPILERIILLPEFSNQRDPTDSIAMRAIRVSEFGGPEVLKLATDAPVPTPGKGQVSCRFQTDSLHIWHFLKRVLV